MKQSFLICLLILYLTMLLSGCGQSGKLYLPGEQKPVKKGFILELT